MGSTLRTLGFETISISDARLVVSEVITGMIRAGSSDVITTIDVGDDTGVEIVVSSANGVMGDGLDDLLGELELQPKATHDGWRIQVPHS